MRGKESSCIEMMPPRGITPAYAGKRQWQHNQDLGVGDHPRVCGEKMAADVVRKYKQGSPPRVRGKAFSRSAGVNVPGITPACAGKRRGRKDTHRRRRDHPRVCGEKAVAIIWWYSCTGSPPRVRGKVARRRSNDHQRGITPACAGKRYPMHKRKACKKDHPRVCGEKLHKQYRKPTDMGSPPRVRGKVEKGLKKPLKCGITPACAGKRAGLSGLALPDGDHPRVCGEKARSVGHGVAHRGSPPRVRGKACWIAPRVFKPRITPACAGKSYHAWHMVVIVWDHPRVCGEKHLGSIIRVCLVGSPPRVRGKERCGRASRMSKGITPACAGKSFCLLLLQLLVEDHPRVCGEKE